MILNGLDADLICIKSSPLQSALQFFGRLPFFIIHCKKREVWTDTLLCSVNPIDKSILFPCRHNCGATRLQRPPDLMCGHIGVIEDEDRKVHYGMSKLFILEPQFLRVHDSCMETVLQALFGNLVLKTQDHLFGEVSGLDLRSIGLVKASQN